MTDLAARVLAAIDETERIAQEATPGPWYTPGPGDIAEWSIYGEGWMIASTRWYSRADLTHPFKHLRVPSTVVEHGVPNAAHIAQHDPAKVLWLCAAIRTIVTEILPKVEHNDRLVAGEWDTEETNAGDLLAALAKAFGVQMI